MEYIFDIIKDIFKDFLMAPLTFVLGLLTIYLKRTIFVGSYKRKLKMKTNDLTVNCFTANPDIKDNKEYVCLGYVFEYMAVGEVRSKWERYYKNLNMTVNMSDLNYNNIRKKYLNDNILIIGGPNHNQVTRELFFNPENPMPFSFDKDCSLVYKTPDGQTKRYTPVLSSGENSYFETDYCLILNVKNPRNPNKRVIALMGCRSSGCYGGAVFMSKHLNKLKNKNLSDEYALVIKCEGEEEDIINDPILMDCFKLNYTKNTNQTTTN